MKKLLLITCPYCGAQFYRPEDVSEPIRCPKCHLLFRLKTKGPLRRKVQQYAKKGLFKVSTYQPQTVRTYYEQLRAEGYPLEARLKRVARIFGRGRGETGGYTLSQLSHILGCADSKKAMEWLRSGFH